MDDFPSHYSLRALLENYAARPRPVVLVLVVATRGSSYRKAGALALIDQCGLSCGCISGGCLEADLLAAGLRALESAKLGHLCLDTRTDEDRWFGSQSGCRGEIEVLLIPSDRCGSHALLDALQLADSEQRALTLRIDLAPGNPSYRLDDDAEDDGAIRVRIEASPRVLLLGAGPEGPPLIELAKRMGWWLEVVEHRARYLAQGRLSGADRVHGERPAEVLERLTDVRFDAVICASHLFDEDRRCLELLAASAVPVIGVLGPVARGVELLAELTTEQRDALAGRVHAPIGIALGAYGPEAVALSIAARLLGFFARG